METIIKLKYISTDPIVQMFFASWLDDECTGRCTVYANEIVFDTEEDAIIFKLKAVPPYLSKHVAIN